MATNSRKQVARIEDINPGDHIVICNKLNEYHGIVCNVNPAKEEVDIVGAMPGGVIESKTLTLPGEKIGLLNVVQYSVDECLPPAQVIDNVLSMVGERVGKSSEPPNDNDATVQADGEKRRARRPVSEIKALQPGDHVAFQRTGYVHHGIVISVHLEEDVFNVAEVYRNKDLKRFYFETRPHVFSEEKDNTVSIVQYEEGECLPTSEVIRNASRLDGESVAYNVLSNNCEHYASALKTGTAISEQAEDFVDCVALVGTSASKFVPYSLASKVFRTFKRAILRKEKGLQGQKGE